MAIEIETETLQAETYLQDHPLTEKSPLAFSQSRKKDFIRAYRKYNCNPNRAALEIGISFKCYWEHYSPDERWYDPVFHAEIVKVQKEFGHDLQNLLYDMAKVSKTSHFNYTIASLRSLMPEIYDRNSIRIGIATNGPIHIAYGETRINPLRPGEEITDLSSPTENRQELNKKDSLFKDNDRKDKRYWVTMTEAQKARKLELLVKAREVKRANGEARQALKEAADLEPGKQSYPQGNDTKS